MIKVGDSFEVVEALNDGGYRGRFKTGSFTIGKHSTRTIMMCYTPNFPLFLSMLVDEEVKLVGKITITKVK